MHKIRVPGEYNYIGVFLTFACNMHCDYCINNFSSRPRYKPMKTDEWIRALNRIETREDLPLTLQGGEPTAYPGFYRLMKGIRKDISVDILTNGMFDVEQFMRNIPPRRMYRSAKYASIRFSYHPGHTSVSKLLGNVELLQREGYSVGIWAVMHPEAEVLASGILEKEAKSRDIDFRVKEFLGRVGGKLHGSYKYKKAMDGEAKDAMCRPSELLIDPTGGMHRCHHNLYHNVKPYAHTLSSYAYVLNEHASCSTYGHCNPCDIKTKFNRFQETGHCSVDIEEI